MRPPHRPTVYEINTAVWLERLGRGRPLELGEVPHTSWGALAALPVDQSEPQALPLQGGVKAISAGIGYSV